MLAITTKYLPPKATKGSRIKARAGHLSATIHFDYSRNDLENGYAAVKALVEKHELGWDVSTMVYGSSDGGNTHHFCFPQSTIETTQR